MLVAFGGCWLALRFDNNAISSACMTAERNILLTAHDLNGCFVASLIELLGELIAAVIVKVGRVDIKDKFTVVGSIRLQAARGDGSGGFQLGE